MVARWWRTDRSVIDALEDEPQRFEFLQVVRLLERARSKALADADAGPASITNRDPKSDLGVPVGEGLRAADEGLRFRGDAALSFPASEIAGLKPGNAATGEPATLTVSFLGLAGNAGPLPSSIAELIQARTSKRDYALRDFLDVFTHRLVSLFVRGKKKHRIGLDNRHPENSHFSDYLFALLGLGGEQLRGRFAKMPDRALLAFAALLHQRPRSMIGLEIFLAHYFGVAVKGRQFAGSWLDIAPDEWCTIGRSGRNQRLGRGALLGTRAWTTADVLELKLGPMPLETFQEFLPNGSRHGPLAALTRYYVGLDMDFRFRLCITARQMPGLRLTANRDKGARLGWTSWLKTAARTRDDAQVLLKPAFPVAQPYQDAAPVLT